MRKIILGLILVSVVIAFWASILTENEWDMNTKEAPTKIVGMVNPLDIYEIASKTEEFKKLNDPPSLVGFVVYVNGRGDAELAYLDIRSGNKVVSFYMDEEGATISEKEISGKRKHGLPHYGSGLGGVSMAQIEDLKSVDEIYQSIRKNTNFTEWTKRNGLDYMVFEYISPKVGTFKARNLDTEGVFAVRSKIYFVDVDPFDGSVLSIFTHESVST